MTEYSTARMPITRQLADDMADLWARWDAVVSESFADMMLGPRLGPGRHELYAIQRPERVCANILANLPAGRPAGAWRGTGTAFPRTQPPTDHTDSQQTAERPTACLTESRKQ